MTTWTPLHESTRDAWIAVMANLQVRAERGLWGSRTIAVTLARNTGLTPKRADDLIRSAIQHGYLEERPSPFDLGRGHHKHPTQIRLTSKATS